MSWQDKLRNVQPYEAGEQPQIKNLIKLNTNENPYDPGEKVKQAILNFDSSHLALYPRPDADALRQALADYHHLDTRQVFVGNGSDEVLALIFLTCFNGQEPVLFPDISYSPGAASRRRRPHPAAGGFPPGSGPAAPSRRRRGRSRNGSGSGSPGSRSPWWPGGPPRCRRRRTSCCGCRSPPGRTARRRTAARSPPGPHPAHRRPSRCGCSGARPATPSPPGTWPPGPWPRRISAGPGAAGSTRRRTGRTGTPASISDTGW